MLSRRQKHILLKFFSMFSVVRGYNILIVVVAQYLTSIYILAYDKPLKSVVFDLNLLILVLASAATIAGGYIINNFYDSEKDRSPNAPTFCHEVPESIEDCSTIPSQLNSEFHHTLISIDGADKLVKSNTGLTTKPPSLFE